MLRVLMLNHRLFRNRHGKDTSMFQNWNICAIDLLGTRTIFSFHVDDRASLHKSQ